MFKKPIRNSIWALIFLSLGGWLLHLRIHPPSESLFDWTPAVFGAISTFVLPVLFNYRATVKWAFVLNVAAVVVGTLTMAFFSATHWQGPVTLKTLLLNSTVPDILVLFAKVPLSCQILR